MASAIAIQPSRADADLAVARSRCELAGPRSDLADSSRWRGHVTEAECREAPAILRQAADSVAAVTDGRGLLAAGHHGHPTRGRG